MTQGKRLQGVISTRVTRKTGGGQETFDDRVAVEEPLEIRIAGDVMAITMRTPGHDHELVMGFLLSEGIVDGAAAVGGIRHCGRPGQSANAVDVTAAPGSAIEWDPEGALRRGTVTTSACGVCGRQSIDDLLSRSRPLEDSARFEVAWVRSLTEQLLTGQDNFAQSGGVHAAALWGGELWGGERGAPVVREDIGRHNAVDKVVGRFALDGRLPATGGALVVSGRASFELVQKAVVARIPLLVSVSAPSSLAVQLAQRSNLTLVGFARGDRFNVYASGERIVD